MLTEKEEKLIKKYCLFPKIAIAAIATTFVLCGVWLILVMIDDIAFNSKSFYEVGLYTFLGFVIIYIIIFCYSMLSAKIGMTKKAWRDIVERLAVAQTNKDYSVQTAGALGLGAAGRLLSRHGNDIGKMIGEGLETAGAIGAVGTAAEMGTEMYSNAKRVAQAYRVEVPKAKRYIIPLVIIPLLVMIAIYIPEYAKSFRVNQSEKQIAAEAVYKLQSALEERCAYVSIDDPNENYQDYGYSVYGYLYDLDGSDNSYVSVKVGNDGIINEIMYHVDVDIHKRQEENIVKAKADIKRLHDLLAESDMETLSSDIYNTYTLSDEFVAKFKEGSYYDEINLAEDGQDSARIYISYSTEPEEEYDEYSRSYIYLYVKGQR